MKGTRDSETGQANNAHLRTPCVLTARPYTHCAHISLQLQDTHTFLVAQSSHATQCLLRRFHMPPFPFLSLRTRSWPSNIIYYLFSGSRAYWAVCVRTSHDSTVFGRPDPM